MSRRTTTDSLAQEIKLGTSYDTDIVAWAIDQAVLLRTGRVSELDLGNIAEELGDLARREQREFANNLESLLAFLLKWQLQPDQLGTGLRSAIKLQRFKLMDQLKEAPSLKHKLVDSDWLTRVWVLATVYAETETGLDTFPEACPWTMDQVLVDDFLPGA